MADFVEPKPVRTIEKLSLEFEPFFFKFSAQSQPAICKNTNDNLSSNSAVFFNIAVKGVWSIKKRYDRYNVLQEINVVLVTDI